jgi:hypothetical protein
MATMRTSMLSMGLSSGQSTEACQGERKEGVDLHV